MGGFFMHSRPGIRTAFLSDDWFAAVNASVSEAADVGLEAWIYDESSYPSGFAGGFVPAKRPDLAQKWLTCRQAQENTDTTAEAKGLFLVTDKEYVPVDAHPSDRLRAVRNVVERHQGTLGLTVTRSGSVAPYSAATS